MGGRDPIFSCEGEMAERMASHDWGRTSLGPPSGWSHSLRTAVAIMLRSRYPMLLSWGDDLVMLYNDAFIPTLGTKHPRALGELLTVGFAEVWDDVGPMQRSVLAGGPATWAEDLPLTIERGDGPEQAYFTFSYSHVPDDEGPGGVLAVLAMTTDKVVAGHRLALLNELATVASQSHDPETAVGAALDVLETAAEEVVGAALFRAAEDDTFTRLGSFGPAQPEVLPYASGGTLHPVFRAWTQRTVITARDSHGLLVALPLRGPDESGTVLVLRPHPLRPYDEAHEQFAWLVAEHVAQVLAVATERARELARAEALAALDAAKTAFLSNVSHEFRTPLTLLLGPLEDVLTGRKDQIDQADVKVMHDGAHRLLRMVNGLLDVARLEADGLPSSPEPTDLAQLTDDVLAPFVAGAARVQLGLDIDLQPGVGIVQVDPTLWEKVVVNLVANALKYTHEGGVTILLRREGDDVHLVVDDTGIGIPESDVRQVFDRFHRVDRGRGRSMEGAGIGLALVSDAARAMGGTVEVQSEVGVGSRFRVVLPLPVTDLPAGFFEPGLTAAEVLAHDVTSTAPRRGSLASSRHDRPNRTIVVAEDNPAMRTRVARILAEDGDVVTVGDGRTALEVMRTRPVHLLVTDVMMPELDGVGLLKEVRADPVLRTTPVVMLSARAGAEAAVGALEAGADDYVVKPFTAAELLARCRTTVELAQHRAVEAAGRARSAMLAGVSHDMQTPLAVITSALELLTTDEMPPDLARRTAARARVRAAQLAQLVTMFLDWSRLSMNEPLPVRRRDADLREVAEQVVADHERATVVGHIGEATAFIDPQRTAQVLHNLVDNAEKVARTTIQVRLSAEEEVFVARVVDDGPGVSPGVLPRLFEAFGPSVGGNGNGLGLHVSREAARAQGGDLLLESTGPEGTVFALVIPRGRR